MTDAGGASPANSASTPRPRTAPRCVRPVARNSENEPPPSDAPAPLDWDSARPFDARTHLLPPGMKRVTTSGKSSVPHAAYATIRPTTVPQDRRRNGGTAHDRNGRSHARQRRTRGRERGKNLVQRADLVGLDVLVAALKEAGLDDLLSGNRHLTVFGPTDDAFHAIGITKDNVGEVNDEFLRTVLQYHVPSGRRYRSTFVNAPQVQTLLGESIDVDGTRLNDGQANIIPPQYEAPNGVLHVIDGVLLPPGMDLPSD